MNLFRRYLPLKTSVKMSKHKVTIPKTTTTCTCVWIKDDDLYVNVFAKPGAKRCGVSDVSDTHVTICVLASPHDGEANKELLRIMADTLGVRKGSVSIERGNRSREKCICIRDYTKSITDTITLFQDSILK